MYKFLSAAACLAVSVSAASAGTITSFTDRSAFESGYSSVVVEDFGDTYHFPISSGVLNSSTNEAGIVPGQIVDGVTFSTEVGSGNFFNIDCCFGGNGTPFLDSVVGDNNLTVTFDTAQSGFGFDTYSAFMSEFDLTINFEGGSSVTESYAPGTGFSGFSSDSNDIYSIVIDGTSSGFPFAIDNFTFTDTAISAVPLPATLPMLLAGVMGFGVMSRRRKSA